MKLHKQDFYCVCINSILKKSVKTEGQTFDLVQRFGNFEDVDFSVNVGFLTVLLFFFPRNLLDKDTFSKSDPCKYKRKKNFVFWIL